MEPDGPVVAGAPGSGAESAGTERRSAPGPGAYVRLELGRGRASASGANWLPPGYPKDPQVFFDLDLDKPGFAGVAVGRSFGSTIRGEIALNSFGRVDFAGPWSVTVPATPGPHADMAGSVRSTAIMANGSYDFPVAGSVTPFVTAGVGVARNTMGNWTRINPDAGRPTRSFEGEASTGLAWSVGVGASMDVAPARGRHGPKLEVSWRYFDLGKARGSDVALPGSGAGGTPTAPLSMKLRTQVISIGLRIPLN